MRYESLGAYFWRGLFSEFFGINCNVNPKLISNDNRFVIGLVIEDNAISICGINLSGARLPSSESFKA